MSTPTFVALLAVLPVTIVALVFVGRALARRVRTAYEESVRTVQLYQPYLDQLERRVEVTRRELERIEASLDTLATDREQRRRDRADTSRVDERHQG